jgi:hypothetical protein
MEIEETLNGGDVAITREQFEKVRSELGEHTSWAVWSSVGEKPKSNVGDLSIFNDEEKLTATLQKLNPNVVLAGLNGSTGDESSSSNVESFANFHSSWSRATDYKIRFATVGTALEGAFMTDIIKHHYETDSTIVGRDLRKNPEYERFKVEEFFDEITKFSRTPIIFAFGGMGYELIKKYNSGRFEVHKLYHYAFTMSKEKFREETIKTLAIAGLA